MKSWAGARWQLTFLPPGTAFDATRPVDAATTAEGHAWAIAVQERLVRSGLTVRLGRDEGEDRSGEPTWYDELSVEIEGASMALCFWVETIFWSVDAFDEDCTEEAFVRAARLVLSVVTTVSGYVLQGHVHPADRTLLGLA